MPSVRESRAGDDFHYLWAARRCLALVDPASDLRLVRLEGPSPTDAPDDDDLFLGVDLIEYFGGESAEAASRVVVSQLKYSTLHPERAWSIARLCELRRPSSNSSVIRRLADAWKGLAALHASDISVGLVSNQPLDSNLADLLAAAGMAAQSATAFARLVAELPEHRERLSDLKTRTGLGSGEFVRFLRALDLSGCGSEPRVFQRLKLVSGVGSIVLGSPSDLAGDLVELVRSTVLPEARNVVGLRRSEVLAQLGASTDRDLFPAPPKFDPVPADAIQTADAPALAARLARSEGGDRLLAHGTFGVGKTTTIQQLEQHLPEGSVVVAYDCFGQGDYRNPGSDRHVVRTALVQLANMVSLRCGLPPLVVSGAVTDGELWRRFERLLDSASEALQPGGFLILAIDAADNALFAGLISGDRTFVPGIWRLPLPECARLLVTCRSQHRDEVGMGVPNVEVELHGFDEVASTAMLRRFALDATTTACVEFHRLTNGNPRLQTYVLEAADAGSVESALEHAADGLDDIFRRIVDGAFERASVTSDLPTGLAVMHAMSPPARVSVLGEALGLTRDKARTLCEQLAPGILIDGDSYGFRDQSFDDYVRDRVGEERWIEANRQLAVFFRDRSGDPYAASALAGHLFNSGNSDAVIALALEPRSELRGDPLWEADIVRRRLHFGALAAARAGRPAEFARVLLAAAYAARSDTTLIAALRDWPELAERFADPDLLTLVHDRAESESWRGPTLLRTAAMLAWSEGHGAESRLRMNAASGWISRWSRLPEDQRRKWSLTARDVAAGAEATYALEGVDRCRDYMWRWRPAEFRLSASRELVQRLVRRLPPHELRAAMAAGRVGRFLEAEAIALYADSGVPSPKSWVLSCGRAIAEVSHDHPAFKSRPGWGTSFCLAAAAAGASQRLVNDLLDRLGTPMPRYAPHEYDDLSNLVSPLLCLCLRHLGRRSRVGKHSLLEELLPLPEGDDRAAERDKERVLAGRREYGTALDLLLPVIEARVGLIRGTCTEEALAAAIAEPLARFKEDGQRWWFKGKRRFATWVSAVAAASVAAGEAGDAPLRSCLDALDAVAGGGVARLRLALGAQLTAGGAHLDLGVQLLEDGASGMVVGTGTASERRDALFEAADAVLGADDVLAEMCFAQALRVARDIDDDAIRQIAAAARLGTSCTGLPVQDRRRLANRLTEAVERSVGRVSDDDYLPIRRVLDTEARLDPDVALRTVARWHQAGVADVEDTVAVIARAGVAAGHLDAQDALALVKLSSDADDRLETILAACEHLLAEGRLRAHDIDSAFNELTLFIGRDIPARSRPRAARRAFEWCSDHGITSGVHFEDIAALARLHATRAAEDQRAEFRTEVEKLSTGQVVDLFNGEDVATFFADMRTRYASAEEIASVLDRSLTSTPPRNRVKALNRLLELMDDTRRSNVQAIAGVIERRALEWEGTAGVSEWFDESVKHLANHHIKDLLVVEGDALDQWRTEMRFPTTATAIEAACLAVADSLADFTDMQLLALAEHLARGLSEDTRLELSESILTDLGGQDTVDVAERSLSRSLVEFCWELLGARDRRPRWRCAHAARHLLVHSPHSDLLAEWAAVLADPPSPEGDPPFLTMSAQVWAWMVTARAVDEDPQRLDALRDQAAVVASDRTFPHASIREFARRTALKLDGIDGPVGGPLAARLALANRPVLCAIDRQSTFNRDDAYEAARAATFDFDTMDTVRYWYQPLAELFGLPTAAIVQRADRWISEVWARTNDECRIDYGHTAERSSWQLMSNDHGSDPTVENLQTYLEYHAMLSVAGELLDEGTPVLCSPYEDAGDPWDRWLRSRLDSSPDWWLADRRGSTPLDEASQGIRPASEMWDELVSAEDPVTVLGLDDGWLWADGHADWRDSEWRVSASVSSALVSPETGPALVRSLLHSNPPSASLPTANSDDGWNDEIHEEGFVLQGWAGDRRDYSEALDDDDPYGLRGAAGGSGPSLDFQAAMGLAANKTETVFIDEGSGPVVVQQIWSNADRDDSLDVSSGNRLVVRLPVLQDYAGQRGLDLVVGLMVDRYKQGRSYGGSDDDEGNRFCRVWIIRSLE
jgi:hypothetical protein